MFATHRLADARMCMELPDGLPVELGAASYVNPLTALGFVETMQKEGFKAIVHTAAASNLGPDAGQALRRGRHPAGQYRAQARAGGAAERSRRRTRGRQLRPGLHAPADRGDRRDRRADRLRRDRRRDHGRARSSARWKRSRRKNLTTYSRYGSYERKKVYIYGALDLWPDGPQPQLRAHLGRRRLAADPVPRDLPPEDQARLRQRVAKGLTTTFAPFKAKIGLEDMLTREAALAYNAKATGEKYLVLPNG